MWNPHDHMTPEEIEADEKQRQIDHETCNRCGEHLPDEVEERYSFGVYAGRFCIKCCSSFRDNCGVGEPQGSPSDLDEPYYEDEGFEFDNPRWDIDDEGDWP